MKILAKTAAACVLAAFAQPGGALASDRVVAETSLRIIQVHDDNLNFSPVEPIEDSIRRVTPALALRFNGSRWKFHGGYSLDSEQFTEQSSLDNDHARERADAGIQYRGTRFTASLDGAYTTTDTLADLNIVSGLAAPRMRARRTGFGPSLRYQMSPRSFIALTAATSKTKVENGLQTRENNQALTIERRATPRSIVSLEYQHSDILFESSVAQRLNTHSALIGVRHEFGPRSYWMLQAGPRMNAGAVSADVAASIAHKWRSASIALSALQRQTTPVGFAGVVDTQTIQLDLALAPFRRVAAYVAPSVSRSRRGVFEATVYHLGVGVRYEMTSYAGFDVNYNIDRQNGAVDVLWADSELSRATLSIGLSTRWSNGNRESGSR